MSSKDKLQELKVYARTYKKFLIAFAVVVILIILIPVLSSKIDAFDPTRAKEYILSFGSLAPVVFIILQVLQVVVAPIPGQATGIAGGYVFGWAMGVFYTTIGLALGTFMVLILTRKFGRAFVERFNAPEAIAEFEKILIPPESKAAKGVKQIKQHGLLTFFLIMLLPALPDDLVCFVAGLSKIPVWQLMIASVVGRFPGMLVLSMVGDGFSTGQANLYNYIFIAIWVIAAVVYLFNKKPIEDWMLRTAMKGGQKREQATEDEKA